MNPDAHSHYADPQHRSQAWLKEEEEEMTKRLSFVRSRLNAAAPISSLPEELFANVFLLVTTQSLPGLRWLYISHVCRQWRAIALRCQLLWSILVLNNTEFLLVSLQRVGSTPLSLMCKPNTNSLPPWCILAPVTNRITGAALSLTHVAMGAFLQHLTDGWDSLDTLSLVAGLPSTFGQPLSFFPCSFQSKFPPRLRDLRLTGVIPRGLIDQTDTFTAFYNLRTLHLSRMRRMNQTPSMDRFLDMLGHCPLLEELFIIEAGPSLDPTIKTPAPLKRAEPRNLRTLHISVAEPHNLAYLLAHLDAPNIKHLFLWQTVVHRHDEDGVRTCLPPDLSYLPLLSMLSSVEVTCDGAHVVLNASRPEPDPASLTIKVFTGRGLDSEASRLGAMNVAFRQLPEIFPAASLKSLVVTRPDQPDTTEDWVTVLSVFSSLESLTVENHQIAKACGVAKATNPPILQILSDGSPFGSSSLPFAPRLVTLNVLKYKRTSELGQLIRTCVHSRSGTLGIPLHVFVDNIPWRKVRHFHSNENACGSTP